VEDADVSSRVDAVAAGIAAAASAQIGGIDQDLEHRNVGQTVNTCYDLAAGDAVAVGLSPGRAEIYRLINVPDRSIRGEAGKSKKSYFVVGRIGCDAGGLGR
jgi:hypothetical protein